MRRHPVKYLPILLMVCSLATAHAEPDYYPLHVGNRWVCAYSSVEGISQHPDTAVSEVVDFDGTYFIIKNQSIGAEKNSESFNWLQKDNEGNTLYCSLGTSREITLIDWDPPLVVFPSNTEPGETWSHIFEQHSDEYPDSVFYARTELKIIGSGETVTVPAGTFGNCVRIQRIHLDAMGDTSSVHEAVYAPGVGNIFSTIKKEDAVYEGKLIEYSVHTGH